jgi:hypothetical protein
LGVGISLQSFIDDEKGKEIKLIIILTRKQKFLLKNFLNEAIPLNPIGHLHTQVVY